jgi:uncharacterized protein (TIGR03000 family)
LAFGGGRALVSALLSRTFQSAPFVNATTAAAARAQVSLGQRLTTAAATVPNLNAATNGVGTINSILAARQINREFFHVARSIDRQNRELMRDVLGFNPYSSLYRGSNLGSISSPYAMSAYATSPYASSYGGYPMMMSNYAPSSSTTDVFTGPAAAPNPAPPAGVAREVTDQVLPGAKVAVDIHVPARDAEVWFEGTQSTKEGLVRSFTSPALGPDIVHSYRIRAKWLDHGRTVDQTMNVPIKAGESVSVEFTAPQREGG